MNIILVLAVPVNFLDIIIVHKVIIRINTIIILFVGIVSTSITSFNEIIKCKVLLLMRR